MSETTAECPGCAANRDTARLYEIPEARLCVACRDVLDRDEEDANSGCDEWDV